MTVDDTSPGDAAATLAHPSDGRHPPVRGWTVGRLLTAGFVLAVITLLVIGGGSYRQIHSQVRDRAAMAGTEQVLEHINGVLNLLTDAETGQRGYVITGQQAYLGSEPQRNRILR